MSSKDLGLLMADPLAQACAEGRKTVTRRPMVDPYHRSGEVVASGAAWIARIHMPWGTTVGTVVEHARIPGAGTATVGQRVWVREAFLMGCASTLMPCGEYESRWTTLGAPILYRADGHTPHRAGNHYGAPYYRVRSSIHMPKWAARTWGTLTSVTPCDLSGIDDAEAHREGFDTAAEFLAVIAKLYPGVRWFWRLEIEWDREEVPHG